MFTIITSEIRWFIKGDLPGNVDLWFNNLGNQVINETERSDGYLILPDASNIGIKIRQGRVEIKKLKQVCGEMKINDKISGHREIWHKWSFDVDHSDKLPIALNLDTSQWIGIRKKRKIHRFAIEASYPSTISADSPFPENGAHIELAHVTLRNKSWWTLGLEAFGNENLLEDHLVLIADKLLKDCRLEYFILENSKGYPEWLAQNLTSSQVN